jgi:pimeloyl-ACP methyl ester carboxylesterase
MSIGRRGLLQVPAHLAPRRPSAESLWCGRVPVARISDVDLYYELHGQGEPVVLIGGLGSDLGMFGGIVARLAATAQVLAFDNRGSGRSGMPDVPYSIDMLAADTAGLMETVSIPAAHLVGISMGGSVALALALAHPELVRGLVLVSASARKPARLTLSWPMRIAAGLQRLGLFRGPHPQPGYAHERQRAASRSYDCTARLAEIRTPTLILHGRRDRTVPRPLAEELHDGIAGSKLVMFDGGHMFFLTRERAQFLDQVEAFLRAPSPGR